MVALRCGDFEAAEAKLRGVMERGGKQPAVYNNLALVLSEADKTEEAMSLLEEGLDGSRIHPRLFLTKSLLHLKLGDPAAAKRDLDGYAETAGRSHPPLYYSARALAEAMSGELAAAAKLVDEGVEQHPASAALANNAGVIHERKGDLARARELYEKAFEQESALPQASKNLGDLLYKEGLYDKAAEAYERALRGDPDLGDDIYAKLGNVYYKSRAREKAVDAWKRALEINPAHDVVRTNLEFVKGADGDGG
jgi:tetratricopeptide (TPR) repeat protein